MKLGSEGWWDSCFVAPFIDNLFLFDCNGLCYNRKEIQVRSHKTILEQIKKADAKAFLELRSDIDLEVCLVETSLPRDVNHQEQDRSKLARCLRSCFFYALKSLYRKEVFDIPFIGIQTFGNLTVKLSFQEQL